MALNRHLSFKIEKLDSDENILEEKSVTITSGNVDVGSGGYRRKCSFTLLEELPEDWQSFRWKLYYGSSSNYGVDPTYYALGVFLPINPSAKEVDGKYTVAYQGVDKVKLYDDYELDEPVTFTAPMDVRDIFIEVSSWFGESKLNLGQNLGTIQVDRTFEEGTTASTILDTIVSAFGDEWFYDTDGFLIARQVVDPTIRPVSFSVDSPGSSLYLSASTDVDDSNYYNSVTVVGGTIDTGIYRASFHDPDAINLAGGRIVKKYFTIDAAVTQAQVSSRATYYLSTGVQLPATLSLTTLVIPNLEIGDIITKEGIKYQTRAFNIPLSTASQTIKSGKVPPSQADIIARLNQANLDSLNAATVILNSLNSQVATAQTNYNNLKAISDSSGNSSDIQATNNAQQALQDLQQQQSAQQTIVNNLQTIYNQGINFGS